MTSATPEGWKRVSLGDLGRFTTSSVDKLIQPGERPVQLLNYMDVYRHRRIDRSIKLMQVTASEAEVARYQVQVGDILFTPSSETPDDIGHSAVVADELPGTVHSYHTVRLRPDSRFDLDLEFRGWMANNENVLRYFANSAAGSTRYTLGLGRFASATLDLPPISEQRRIAEILTTLDEAIEQTEALIAKHQQIKAGLMHDLFTRGVTPDGHLRPTREQAPGLYNESPLGWIPKEWVARPLRDLTIKIADRDHTTPEYVDDGVIMVSPTNLFDDEGIDFAACRNIPLRDHLINRKKTDIEAGDLILHRIGAGLGAVRLVTDDMPEFSILHSMALVRPLCSAVSAEYLLWSFRSYPVLLQMDIGTQSIGVPDLGLDKIGSLLFPVAPQGEQTIIANSLRTQTEAGSAEMNRLIKLRHQKHGLMHDLLTGTVRVKIEQASAGSADG